MNKIRVRCDVKDTLPLGRFVNLQGNLKSLSTENYQRLRKQILDIGFTAPIFIWKNKNKILDGHQRLKTVQQMVHDKEIECAELPVVGFDAESEDEARKMLAGFVSQYGKVEEQGLYEFAIESNWSPAFMLETMDIPGFEMSKFLEGHFDEFKVDSDSSKKDNEQTFKIMFEVVVECKDESEQQTIFEHLTTQGLKCRILSM